MRLSRSESVAKRRKDKKLRNQYKGKKKHKKLDAICEEAYTSSHRGVQQVESLEVNNGGKELELRRSNRARKAPVLLDSSPLPPKKRQKVDGSVASSVEKSRREERVQCEPPCSTSRDLEQNDDWRLRLRHRGRNTRFSGRGRGKSSLKGKRKLFDDGDGFRDDVEPQCYNRNEGSVNEKSTVVKSKRPGRVKASNVLANENQESSLQCRVEDGKDGNRDQLLEVMDEVDELHLETKLEYKSELGVEDEDQTVASWLAEREETAERAETSETEETTVRKETAEKEVIAVQKDSELEECHNNGDIETRGEYTELNELACNLVPEKGNVAEVDCDTPGQAKDEGHPDKDLEDETIKKLKGKYNAAVIADRKPRIKLGRHCGLCGGGIDGKPPKVLVLEGAGSDDEAYSGSSASEEPNYDVWDGFGDQAGWLGRLLGPINDRFGIAGIWVHQQCAVWSPEVCFIFLNL